MKVGLTGFPGAGKTAVFAALTGLRPDPADRRAQIGTIKVPDPRVDYLAGVYRPKKTTYAEVTFVDFPPARDAQKRTVLDQEAVTALRDADALVEVVRGFADLAGTAPRPLEDIDAFDGELVLADLAQVEKRAERVKKEKGKEREVGLLARLQEHLEAGTPLRTMGLTADERTELAGFAFLSLRPLLVVLNVGEADVATPLPAEVDGADPVGGRRGDGRCLRRSRPRSRSSSPATGRPSWPIWAWPRARAIASSGPATGCST